MAFKVYNSISQILNITKHADDEAVNDDEEASNKLRTGYGMHVFKRDYVQKYAGQFLFNNLHGQGTYVWYTENDNNGERSIMIINIQIFQFNPSRLIYILQVT